jgi:Protein of unknown function with PCYCGC motif
MKVFKIAIILSLVLSVLFEGTLFSADHQKEFNEIGKMDLKQLTSKAKAALDKRYPGEKWEQYKFPKYVYIHDAVQTAYKIAVKNTELLAKFPCYCFCEPMGHKNLAYCFLEKGVKGKFDDHASTCNICVTQALMAFLWDEIGATVAEMQEAMKEIYGK